MARRVQAPEPKYGQKEYDLFKELYGKRWDHYDGLQSDPEHKPTTHDYERYLPEGYLEHVDHRGPEFRHQLKKDIL